MKKINAYIFSLAVTTFPLLGVAQSVTPLEKGDSVPSVEVMDAEGTPHNLSDLTKGDKTILVFYRGGWCPYCTTHLRSVAEIQEEIQNMGYSVIAISPDRVELVAEAMKEKQYPYRIFSDASGAVVRAFGLAFEVNEETYGNLLGFGINLEEASGEDHRQLPVPAVYVINEDGVIVFQHYDSDYRQRLSSEELLSVLQVHERQL